MGMLDDKIRSIWGTKENPTVFIEKTLENIELLKKTKIKCCNHPSLMEGINNYFLKHKKEWNLQEEESIGVKIKGKSGYNASFNQNKYGLKTIEFYRIKDIL
jgi:hypothetical protein